MSASGENNGGGFRIEPAAFEPPRGDGPGPGFPWIKAIVAPAGLILLGALIWFTFTMRAISIEFEPAAEAISLSGLTIPFGEHYLARPGTYRLSAERSGYHPIRTEVEVPERGEARFGFSFEPLPGRLSVRSRPQEAEVRVNGEPIGITPLDEHLIEAGEYTLEVHAPYFLPHSETIAIAGRDEHQEFEIELKPATGRVSVTSDPPGATIVVEGENVAETPATVRVPIGEPIIALEMTGYRRWSQRLEIEGGEELELGPVELELAPARLRVTSQPTGATVRVAGRDHGHTPVVLNLPAEEPVTLQLSAPGHQTITRRVTLEPDTEQSLRGILPPILGRVVLEVTPEDALIRVDGEEHGRGGQTLELPSREHELSIERDGYVALTRRVTPDPDATQTLRIELLSEIEARLAELDEVIEAANGARLRLIEPARFTMGSPHGEQGRRSDELQREVELARLFYIGTHEITNAQFRQFRSGHSSSIVGDHTLDNERQPAVRISWHDAAAFCNWLSERDDLPPAYRAIGGGRYELIRPVSTGYRLPTEAEWEYAARFADGRARRYPWGQEMPPPPGAGNFADRSASGLLPTYLENYDDGYPASAPVGSFEPTGLGLYDMGGNVSEWTNDYYSPGLTAMPEVRRDPLGPETGSERTIKGASWRHSSITHLRLAWRGRSSEAADDLGFRIARYVD